MLRGRSYLVVTASMALACSLAGCQAGTRQADLATARIAPSAGHLLFNPERTPAVRYDVSRSDWPVAYVADHHAEELTLRETIIDRQGSFGRHEDFYLRRVRTVRTGRFVR